MHLTTTPAILILFFIPRLLAAPVLMPGAPKSCLKQSCDDEDNGSAPTSSTSKRVQFNDIPSMIDLDGDIKDDELIEEPHKKEDESRDSNLDGYDGLKSSLEMFRQASNVWDMKRDPQWNNLITATTKAPVDDTDFTEIDL
ncbi:hypothetical protein FRB97_001849 [Tulasnella sp. 331]|nr:hypothetical protein FRB97_001849 [Tulasnella sp. 331]